MQAVVRRVILGTIVTGLMSMMGLRIAAQGAPAPSQVPPRSIPMAEEVFKNVRALKGIPVDEFLDTMGMFAAATTKDCTGCHDPRILNGEKDAFAIDTPMIQRARMMAAMVNTINRNYFGSQRRVTCYTCHSSREIPPRIPNLTVQYGEPQAENPNRLEFTAIPDRRTRSTRSLQSSSNALAARSAGPVSTRCR